MKPLYLDGSETVVLLDGPALRIRTPCSADRWFPVRRLSQVVSSSQVQWETAAMLACVTEGVTVSFLDGDGTLIARCIGRTEKDDALQDGLDRLWLRADWPVLYGQWLAAMENMAVRSVLRRGGLRPGDGVSAKHLRQGFRQAASSMDATFAYERIGRAVHSLLLALVTQGLLDSRVDVARVNGTSFNLASDLAEVLFWDFQLARMAWLENRLSYRETVEAPDREEIVKFFERRRTRTEKLMRGLIQRLHRWLLELS